MRYNIKTILVILFSFVAVACTKKTDYKLMTIIGFTNETYGINEKKEAELTVLANSLVTGEILFTTSGELKEGIDFELIDKSFKFNNSMEAKVSVKFLKDISEKSILEFKLLPVEFATLALSKAQIGGEDEEPVIYSFEASKYYMTETADVFVKLSRISEAFKSEIPVMLEVEVDTKESTAIEGKHFSFPNGKRVTIPVSKDKAAIKLKLLKEEKGKDKIVLRLKAPAKNYRPGKFEESSVLVYVTSFENLTGDWKHVTLSTYDYLAMNTEWAGDDPKKLPRNNTANDILRFDNDNLTVSLTGDLKNYFRNTKLVKKGETIEVLMEEPGYPKVNVILVNGRANVPFSAKKIEERQAEMGLRLRIINGKEYLDVTVRDYEPIDFLQNTYDMVKDWGMTPAMQDYPLRYRFERVE